MNTHQTVNHQVLFKASLLSFFLAFIKLIAFFTSGSLLVLGSFLDSLADAFASLVNHYVYHFSRQKADQEHPFGHGGFEVVASLIQGMIISFLGGSLLLEVFRKAFDKDLKSFENQDLTFSLIVLLLSAFGGFFIYYYINKETKKLEAINARSLSLAADKAHYASDALGNALGFIGLCLVFVFKVHWLDLVFGGMAACILIASAVPILKKSLKDILHSQVPAHLQRDIVDTVIAADSRILGLHMLRTREMGPILYIDFHLRLPCKLTLEEAHSIGDHAEDLLKQKYSGADILIHLDPDSEPEEPTDWTPALTHSK